MRKIKCETCSTYHQGFHLCLGRKPEEIKTDGGTVLREKKPKNTFVRTQTQLSAFEQSKAKRWARYHEVNRERDEKILNQYNEGASLYELAMEFGVGYNTVRSIILRLGGKMRPTGKNVRFNKEYI
jgi:hypothetical protein